MHPSLPPRLIPGSSTKRHDTHGGTDDGPTRTHRGDRHREGQQVRSLTATAYVADPTGSEHERVTLQVCMDNSRSTWVDRDGHPVTTLPTDSAGSPVAQVSFSVEMQRQQGDHWTVDASGKDLESC